MRSPALTGVLATTVALMLGSFAPSALAACPNEAARTGLSANLPDCRAYEMVSPPDKGGYDIDFYGASRSSSSGDAFTYQSNGAFAGAAGAPHANDYVARRTSTGWMTTALTPRQDPSTYASIFLQHAYYAFTADLSTGVFLNSNPPGLGESGTDVKSFYLRSSDGSYKLLTPVPANNPGLFYQPTYAGSSADMSHVFFESTAQLLPTAPAGVPELYEWDNGAVRIVGILPNGTIAPEGAAAVFGPSGAQGTTSSNTYSAISGDGSQIVFSSGSPAQLYLRANGASTVALSVSQKTGSVGQLATHGATFMGSASEDGKTLSKVFFTSQDELTNDANTGHGEETVFGHGSDLYEYDVASGSLQDLTVDSNPEDTEGARVGSGWMVSTADGGYIYFIASGVLASGGHFNEENLYYLHGGSPTYVGPASSYDIGQTQLSADGSRLMYATTQALTHDPTGGFEQVYLYDAPSQTWTCTSCVAGTSYVEGAALKGFLTGYGGVQPPAHNLSADGRQVFFQTANALLPQDTNGQQDVYEWEDGVLHLISTGQSAGGENFLNASLSGDDVFISSRQRLLPADQDANVDVYDARVGGGTPRPLSPPACTGTGCQGVPPAPPIFATPPSVTYSGVGNFAPAPKPSTRTKPAPKPKRKHKSKRSKHVRGKRGSVGHKQAKGSKSSSHATQRAGR